MAAAVIFFVTLFLVTSNALGFTSSKEDDSKFCHSDDVDSHLHLSTRTPYRVIHDQNRKQHLPDIAECEPKQIWMTIRHGARNPSSFIIEGMHHILPKLRDQIVESYHEGKGSLCKSEVEKLLLWTPKVNISEAKDLVEEGEIELENLGSRILNNFPELFRDDNTSSTFKFRHTATQRTYKSAFYFAEGVFGTNGSQKVNFFKANQKHDPLLRFYKHCSKWTTNIDDKPDTGMRQKVDFNNGTYFAEVRHRIAGRTSLNDVSNLEVDMMYQTCAFESSWNASTPSPWCAVFSKADFEVLEYSSDLKYYWNDGYGFPVNYEQACPLVQDMLAHFKNASAESTRLKGVFYFTHSGALLKLLAHLGLYQDKEPLWHHNFDLHKSSRLWRVSKIDSFASNLAAILYSCDSSPKVLLLHQEQPIVLKGCPEESPFLCPLNKLVEMFPDCPFDQICNLEPKKGPNIEL